MPLSGSHTSPNRRRMVAAPRSRCQTKTPPQQRDQPARTRAACIPAPHERATHTIVDAHHNVNPETAGTEQGGIPPARGHAPPDPHKFHPYVRTPTLSLKFSGVNGMGGGPCSIERTQWAFCVRARGFKGSRCPRGGAVGCRWVWLPTVGLFCDRRWVASSRGVWGMRFAHARLWPRGTVVLVTDR